MEKRVVGLGAHMLVTQQSAPIIVVCSRKAKARAKDELPSPHG
jgi:hypothetical protein